MFLFIGLIVGMMRLPPALGLYMALVLDGSWCLLLVKEGLCLTNYGRTTEGSFPFLNCTATFELE
jgi:hypothetical protein